MYTMKADGVVFYDPSSNDMALQVLSPKAKFELNKADRLTFVMLPGNVMYDRLNKLKTIVTLEQDGEEIFRGRVLETTTDLYNQKEVYCEGELGYLLDSVQRPYEFDGSAKEYFTQLIANHNADVDAHKRFTVGLMTALTDDDTVKVESDEYTGTMAEIQSLLLDEFKGYLRIRYAGGVRYLDYVDKFNQTCSQEINFGVNLVDIENTVNAQDVCSVLIPVGKTSKGKITTIADANSGQDYIESLELIAKYGRVVKTYTFDDVEDPSELLELGIAHMAKMEAETTLTITAVDLKTAGANADGIRLGDTVKLVSSPHGLNKEDVCTKIALPLEKPEKAEYTFGLPFETLTDSNASASRKAHNDSCKLHEWIKATDTELTIAKQHVSEFGDTVSNVLFEMDAMNASILLKADQSVITDLESRVSSAEVLVDGMNAEIKLIATQHSINELVERLSAAEIEIDGLNAEIDLIATEETIEEFANRLTEAEIRIDGAEALIEAKASKSEVEDIGSRLSKAELDIDGANAQIALKASRDEMSTMDRRLSQAEVDIDGAKAQIALKASLASFEALTARVSQAEIDINGAEAAIALKASNEYVNGIERRVSAAEVDIDGMNATIALKASKDDYDGVAKRLTQAEVAIDGANANIALKADKSSMEALGRRLTQAEIDIDGAEAAINLKASKESMEALGERLTQAEVDIDGAEASIALKASKSSVEELGDRVTQAEIDIDGAEAQIALKASKDSVDAMGKRLTQAEIDIDGAQAAINLKANADTVTSMGRRLTSAEADIDGLEGQISLMATKKEVSDVSETLSTVQTDLNAAEAAIALKANQTTVKDLTTRVSSAEVEINAAKSSINLKASQSDLTKLTNRVSSAELRIDGAESAIRAKADLILLDGYVKASDLETQVLEVVESANIYDLTVTDFNAYYVSGVSATFDNISAEWFTIGGETVATESHSHKVTVNTDGTITLGEVSSTGGSFKIADTAYYKNGVSAARTAGYNSGYTDAYPGSVTTDVSYNSRKVQYEVAATVNLGDRTTKQFTLNPIAATSAYNAGSNSVTLSEGSWSSNKKTITASNGKKLTVDASGIYSSGETAGYNSGYGQAKPKSAGRSFSYDSANNRYNVTATVDSVDGTSYSYTLTPIPASSAYNAGSNSVTLSQGDWSNNKVVVTASNGETLTVDATSIYNSGVSSGKSAVTLSAAGWKGGSNIVSASNGKSVTINLPTFSVSGGTTWTNNKTTVYFSTASVSGYLQSKTVDATSVYDAGYDAGYAAGYQAAKDATTVVGGITSITNPAQNYYTATGWASARVNGEQVDYTTFNKSQGFQG